MPRKAPLLAPADPVAPDVRLVRLDTLSPDPDNVRVHPETNLRAIRDSLTAFGQQRPLVVMPDGLVLAGNGTLEAARQLGWQHIAVQVCTLPLDQARAYAVADNRTGELSSWNETGLATLLKDLQAQALPLPFASCGHYDAKAWRFLTQHAQPGALFWNVAGEADAAAWSVPAVAPTWLVGDSREMATLLPDTAYDLLWTCPPYADLECYSDDSRDLSTMEYPDFLMAYRQIIAASVARLRDDRFAAIVVGDIRDTQGYYRNFVSNLLPLSLRL